MEEIRTASHVGLWIGLIAIIGFLAWSATHNHTKNEKFADNAKQTNIYHIHKNYGLGFVDLALMPLTFHGCVRGDKPDAVNDQAVNEVVDAKTIINAVSEDKK